MRRPVRLSLWLSIIYLCICSSIQEEEEAEETDDREYLYYGEEWADNVNGDVLDFRPEDVGPNGDVFHPDFLFAENQGPRVVEFYAPWCPHCQHYRAHYVQFAKQVKALAKEQGAEVQVYAVSCLVHKPLCQYFGVRAYPRIHIFPAGATKASDELLYWQVHPFDVLNRLGIQTTDLSFADSAADAFFEEEQQIALAAKQEKQQKAYRAHRRTKQEVFDDAYRSFVFAMQNGVFMTEESLTQEQSNVLWSFLDLLKKVLPPTWSVQRLIKDLLDNFQEAATSEESLLAIVKRHPPPKATWSLSCTKGKPGMGYTCGLWELFHIMTVGVVEWNLLIGVDDTDEMIISINGSADILRNFIEHFFGCDVCRHNFVTAYDRCAYDRCNRLEHGATTKEQWVELPAWLWEMHNGVNRRLFREERERQRRPSPSEERQRKREWPSRRVCPDCWFDDNTYDSMTIYKYLRLEYWPDDIVTVELKKELGLDGNTAVGGGEQEDDDDNFYSPPAPPALVLQMVPLFIFGGLGLGWYARSVHRRNSGWHKKVDTEFLPLYKLS